MFEVKDSKSLKICFTTSVKKRLLSKNTQTRRKISLFTHFSQKDLFVVGKKSWCRNIINHCDISPSQVGKKSLSQVVPSFFRENLPGSQLFPPLWGPSVSIPPSLSVPAGSSPEPHPLPRTPPLCTLCFPLTSKRSRCCWQSEKCRYPQLTWSGCLAEQSWGHSEDMAQLPQKIIPSPSLTSPSHLPEEEAKSELNCWDTQPAFYLQDFLIYWLDTLD